MTILFNKEQEYLPVVNAVSQTTGVPSALILAHIKQESAFNPRAFRNEPKIKDASYGLMQLLLGTASKMDINATPEKLYDPAYNITLGATYIAQNLARYPGDIQSAIASYNAGTAYKDANGKYISKSGNDVQHYVDKVMRNYNTYSEWLGRGAQLFDPMIDSRLVVTFFALSGLVLLTAIGGRYAGYNRSSARQRRRLQAG